MATMYYDKDADIELIRGRRSPSSATAARGTRTRSTCKDSGVDVVVGLPAGEQVARQGAGRRAQGADVAEAAEWADVIMILIPDTAPGEGLQGGDRAAASPPGKTLMFAHGFNIRFNCIVPPADVDVSMVAPKAPGPPRARGVQGGRRHAGPPGRAPGRDRQGEARPRWPTRRASAAPAPA